MNLRYEKVSINDCMMLKRNPQYMSEKQMESLKESIQMDGFLAPIVLRPKGEKYEILSGNHRWLAAKACGLAEIPAVIGDLTDKQAQRIAINMNTVHGDPTPELMAPFLADMEDDILASCHFEDDFLQQLASFDEALHDRLNSLEIPDQFDQASSTAPLPKNTPSKPTVCPHCGQSLD